jgi:hypothetical protein
MRSASRLTRAGTTDRMLFDIAPQRSLRYHVPMAEIDGQRFGFLPHLREFDSRGFIFGLQGSASQVPLVLSPPPVRPR